MEINNKFKNIAIAAVALIALALVGAFIYNKMNVKPKTEEAAPQPLEIKKVQVPATQLPGNLPSDLPIEKDAKVLQNFSATVDNLGVQYTRSYETKKSLAENLAIFTDYLKKNGWTITATLDKEQYKMVAGRKGKDSMQVQMNTDPETKAHTVSISLTQFPK